MSAAYRLRCHECGVLSPPEATRCEGGCTPPFHHSRWCAVHDQAIAGAACPACQVGEAAKATPIAAGDDHILADLERRRRLPRPPKRPPVPVAPPRPAPVVGRAPPVAPPVPAPRPPAGPAPAAPAPTPTRRRRRRWPWVVLALLLFWGHAEIKQLTEYAMAQPPTVGWTNLDGTAEASNEWAVQPLPQVLRIAFLWKSSPIEPELHAAVSHLADIAVIEPRFWGILSKEARAVGDAPMQARMEQRQRWATNRVRLLGDTTTCLVCLAKGAFSVPPSSRELRMRQEAAVIRTDAVRVITTLSQSRVGRRTIVAQQKEAVVLNRRFERLAWEWQALWWPRESTRRAILTTARRLAQADLMIDAAECRRVRRRCELLASSAVIVAGRLVLDPIP